MIKPAKTEEDPNGDSTVGKGQEISEEGVVFEKGSIYDRLQGLRDLRKAGGKRYSLTTVLMVVLLAKLSGAFTINPK